MSTNELTSAAGQMKKLRGIQANTLAVTVMILIEFSLGLGVNLYVNLPKSDLGKNFIHSFGRAISSGPLALALHAILGTLILVSGLTLVIRTWMYRKTSLIVPAIIGFLGVLAAWSSGTRFVGTEANSASLAMGIATAVSILCYAIVLFLTPSHSSDSGNL